MSIVGDIKNVSEAALGKLAAQFGDLPKPLLAAIGAGDAAVEQLAKLRERLMHLGEDDDDNGARDAQETPGEESRLGDLAGKAQKVMGDVAHRLEDMAEEVSDKTQQMIADLPAKAQEVANSLSRENLRSTVENYTQRVADVYRDLADRGGERVQAAEDAPTKKAADATKSAAQKTAAAEKPAAKKPSAKKAAAKKPVAARKPAAKKPAESNPLADGG